MKKPLFIVFLVLTNFAFNQSGLAQNKLILKISVTGNIYEAQLPLDDDISVSLDPSGTISIISSKNVSMDYYSSFDSDVLSGKVSQIGNKKIEYYASFRDDEINGKLSNVGNIAIEYFRNITESEKSGKVSRIGFLNFDYYKSFDGEARAGRLSKIGNAAVVYSLGGENNGKVASIGNVKFSYYIRADGEGKAGRLRAIEGKMDKVEIQVIY